MIFAAFALCVSLGDVTAATPLAKGTILSENHLDGQRDEIEEFIGLETKRPIYDGRVITLRDVGPATVVARQSSVSVTFRRGGLLLKVGGRALSDGAIGEAVRVRIDGRRQTLSAIVTGPGTVEVRS